ncbi:hypothetical protein BDU57DRAFT_120274 [Ampelomyces quisqualis]|uniref:Uncharacterized protein n=1 Tax=Ampelomyces quisqualis TaxID=50730 RepID=A0A6A5QW41_AMPQU|nr:hypothetical protein BDU57DRAFT_120274 [Ampelomyces quisqualis]
MSPPFYFRIDEFTENHNANPEHDINGKWVPSTKPGANVRKNDRGATGHWWICDGTKIRSLPGWTPPHGSVPYKTCSTIYSGGHGFHIMDGDATSPSDSAAWHHLWFEWDERKYSSALTYAGEQRTLRIQNSEARWPSMLLPDIYHGPHYPTPNYGGLTGDLPIFLALIAFSMKPERLSNELPKMMRQGEWGTHSRSNGRTDKRGVIVYVYSYNDNDGELAELEDGDLGFYYN